MRLLPATDPDSHYRTADGFGPVEQKDIDPSTAGDQHDGLTFTFTIPAEALLRGVALRRN